MASILGREIVSKRKERKTIRTRVLDKSVERNKVVRNDAQMTQQPCQITHFSYIAAEVGYFWKLQNRESCRPCNIYFPELANQTLAFDGTASAYLRPEALRSGVEVGLKNPAKVSSIRLYPGSESIASDPSRMKVEGYDGENFVLISEKDVALPTARNTADLTYFVDVDLNNNNSYDIYKITFPQVVGEFDESSCTDEEGGQNGCRLYPMVIGEIELRQCKHQFFEKSASP